MFADDTNFFYTHKNVNCLFCDVNKELSNISEWFAANKLSQNVEKRKHFFLHKPSKKGNTPLQLPNVTINNRKIKIIGVSLDEKVTWKEHRKFMLKILACYTNQSIT